MAKSGRVKSKKVSPPLLTDEENFFNLFSLDRLKKTWSTIRRELKESSLRDAVDWIDWIHTIDNSIIDLLEDIRSGVYQPSPPTRYELAKAKGSFRFMTVPNVRDALVFRHISDEVLRRATPHKVKGAYFSRRHSSTPVGPKFELYDPGYSKFFDIWLRYQEYRTRTLLNSPYEILVVTDISNYFDSIQHDLLMEYLAPLGLPRCAIALLGRLLEVLKPASGHSPNPRVGLPVDELDCSRQIAHFFLFEHDRRIAKVVGEDHYVRWMDDQNIGVRSPVEARKVVNLLTRSLAEQRLTLNAGKTIFLEPEAVVTEFHLDINRTLTNWEKRWKKADTAKKRGRLGKKLKRLWDAAPDKGKGHWEKVLKRFYGYVAIAKASWLDELTYEHLIEYPGLHQRIFESFSKRGEIGNLIGLFKRFAGAGECLYEATEANFFDALLLANADPKDEKQCISLVEEFLTGKIGKTSGKPRGVASAVLCYYWFGGDLASIPGLLKIKRWSTKPEAVVRAILAVTAGRDPRKFREMLASLAGYPGDDVGRLVQFIDAVWKGSIPFIVKFAHPKKRWPLSGSHYDARAWLCLEILARSKNKAIRKWLRNEHSRFRKLVTTRQEQRCANRVARLLRK